MIDDELVAIGHVLGDTATGNRLKQLVNLAHDAGQSACAAVRSQTRIIEANLFGRVGRIVRMHAR